jgi:hypothetical protein
MSPLHAPLVRAIDDLLAFVAEYAAIPRHPIANKMVPWEGKWQTRFEELDQQVWVAARLLNYQGDLPARSPVSNGYDYLGKTNLLIQRFALGFHPIKLESWRNQMLNLRALAEITAKGPTPGGGEERPADAGMGWEEAAERLERLRVQGEAWPGYREMAKRLDGCSTGTVHKAIRSTPELIAWAKRQAAPRAQQSLDNEKAGTKENVPQQREPDPAEEVTDAELRARFEKAGPEERAFLNEITGASRQVQLWYAQQSAPRRKACREQWAAAIGGDAKAKAWFLGLSVADQLAFFDDPGSCQRALPRP